MKIGKDGLVFIALMLLVAFMASRLTSLIVSFVSLGALFYVARIAIATMSGESIKATIDKLNTVGFEFTECSVPKQLRLFEQYLLNKLSTNNEDLRTLNGKFLQLIQVHNGSRQFPEFYYNGIVKKMMWEYEKKHGDLNVKFDAQDLLSLNEITQPIPPTDVDEFQRFCMAHTL